MHSPKFRHKANEFKRIVASSVLADLWSKKRGVRDHMRRQIIPDAVEFLDFHMQHRQRCARLETLICNGDYIPSPILRMKVEKGKGLCRQVALPSPGDALILQALSNSLWSEIKLKAPSAKAFFAPQDQPFAKLNPLHDDDEFGYGPVESWLDFQEEILKFSQKRKYVIVTDIANYYDGILHTFLRSILADYGLEREYALDLLLFILETMLWRPDYMPNPGIGLPQMNLDAPRLLGHTHLYEVDELFSADPDVEYARYMDDMDFGVDNLAKAKSVLRDLDLTLHTRNIRLNSGKTKIMTSAEALKHFRVRDNLALVQVIRKIELAKGSDIKLKRAERLVGSLVRVGIQRRKFDDGNGGKILKRLLGFTFRNGFEIDDASFREILYNRPALREYLLQGWIRSRRYRAQMSIVIGYLGSGQAIDDYSKILVSTSIVSAVHEAPLSQAVLYELIFQLKESDPFSVFARLMLVSRLDTTSRLLSEIQKTHEIWGRHAFLARQVASFYGIFLNTASFKDFEETANRYGGAEARSVLDFHEGIATRRADFYAARAFVKAGNPSMPTRISHAKIMMLASALWNKDINKIDRAKLLGHHAHAMLDTYYRSMLSQIISVAP